LPGHQAQPINATPAISPALLNLTVNGVTVLDINTAAADADVNFSNYSIASLIKGPDAKEKRFILFTGEGSRARRAIVLAVFNGQFNKLPPAMSEVLLNAGYEKNLNKYGDICWVIGITGAGAEGISLKCCRSVHIMEPYWNNVRLEQVKGRAVRICSHKDLPYDQRTVDVYMYYTIFTQKQMKEIDRTIQMADRSEAKARILTSDEKVYEVSSKKDKVNGLLLDLMKRFAVDCVLNNADNTDVEKCTVVQGHSYEYMFDPDIEKDITDSTTVKEMNVHNVARGSTDSTSKATTIKLSVMKYEDEMYVLYPKAGTANRIFYLFLQDTFKGNNPDPTEAFGEVSINPITDKLDMGSTVTVY
jgi:hypothetical protein